MPPLLLLLVVLTLVPAGARADLADIRGVWEPSSRNYYGLGNLVLGRKSLTWGSCKSVPYKILKEEQGAIFLEVLRDSGCRPRGTERFLILDPTYNGLEVSICDNADEFPKPAKDRSCSWGILTKRVSSDRSNK